MTPPAPAAPPAPASTAPSMPAVPEPAGTTIVRAYFFFGGEPGTEGLVPVLREMPQTTGGGQGGDAGAARRPDGRGI